MGPAFADRPIGFRQPMIAVPADGSAPQRRERAPPAREEPSTNVQVVSLEPPPCNYAPRWARGIPPARNIQTAAVGIGIDIVEAAGSAGLFHLEDFIRSCGLGLLRYCRPHEQRYADRENQAKSFHFKKSTTAHVSIYLPDYAESQCEDRNMSFMSVPPRSIP